MNWRVIQGDALERLRDLPELSVQTCVTSPPYFGLRDYGDENQLGLESTPDEYVARLVEVFREVRRVLRDDGTVWLNLGDSYAGSWGAQSRPLTEADGRSEPLDRDQPCNGPSPSVSGLSGNQIAAHPKGRNRTGSIPPGAEYKPKDLFGIPWLVAFALRADGWYLRSDIIWSKPNPMPESVTDRPTKAHEYLFLLSKKKDYYFDADAIREEGVSPEQTAHNERYAREYEAHPARAQAGEGIQPGNNGNQGIHSRPGPGGRNKRSVWTVSTMPFPGAHFAVFPPKLIEPCVLAGGSETACGVCGAPWERVVERSADERKPYATVHTGRTPATGAPVRKVLSEDGRGGELPRRESHMLGWQPTCAHNDDSGFCTVLDPFAGAGTTGVMALRHGCSFIGIELNESYCEMARNRIRDDAPLFNWPNEVAA